jgi:hypothetical protein
MIGSFNNRVDRLDRARLNFGRVSGLHVQDQLRSSSGDPPARMRLGDVLAVSVARDRLLRSAASLTDQRPLVIGPGAVIRARTSAPFAYLELLDHGRERGWAVGAASLSVRPSEASNVTWAYADITNGVSVTGRPFHRSGV